ncbi:M23 family metallopeptidase [Xanthomonas campestris]|uniref:M23 family metallopeptidase n=1 Tax=Xanthomonas campestris TaxID=339 RepID=UPI00096DCE18|nr:M23 family metallopeptidase [Xanthomonas campestris]MCF8825395.1 M23 family metallopeptidase [Xanthomonas campestris pv. raphani]MEA9877221.1 M23 family metallopeptidase [Xanthomonas campestris pv. raphani]MEA9893639.1 M23 family metallopeptidase [Xanthomonas campestris pv. raphani]MEA9931566.1 M23 family metallopeptidase [Xanthomonas campestris pv. raphani]
MKTLMMLIVGVLIGAAGYWWLDLRHATDPVAASPAVATPATASAPAAQRAPASAAPEAMTAATPLAAAPAPAQAASAMAAPVGDPSAAQASASASASASDNVALLIPVQGITSSQLQDTFTDARSEGRVHDAIDILAPAGTPVLAVADGTVEKLFDSKRGGLTVYQFEPGGKYCYYYAHLQRYADGLAEKQVIKRGQLIGYVGSTGNADPAAPHLHFEIHRLGPEREWWKGEALNPYPVLHGDQSLQ